ncbi:hypothetical protein I4U23_003680 [Adineta vaga]|nr:hypothetical protein I4U23_003680 [Adineta vaga]
MPFDLVPNQSAQQDYDLNGWKYPPKDYKKWISLIQTFLKHLDERYGKQIENWYFEVWNEPNILNYWLGTVEDYCHLHDFSVQALKSINPNLKIGGPALATNGSSGDFLEKFLEHITNAEIPIDFISFHIKGAYFSPLRSYGHKVELEYPSISRIITDIQTNLNIINQFPNLNNVSIFIDECDPTVGAIYEVYDNPNFVVCNTEYYPSVIAEMIYTILSISPRIHLICNSLFYMEGKRLFEGNRTFLTNYNLHLPVMNGFKLFEKLQTKQFSIEIKDNHIPLHGISTFHEANSDIQLLLFSHIDDYTLYENQNVTIIFNNMKLNYVLVRHYKIDANNNNIYSEWVKFGKPDYLNSDQLKYFQNFQELKLFDKPIVYQVENNQLILNGFNIYTHSTDFIEIINLDVSSSQ